MTYCHSASCGNGVALSQAPHRQEPGLEWWLRARWRRAVDDLRVGLLRHWSLLEALRYSPYVAVRLHTWRDAGQHMLHLLLARCGVPLKQAKLAYSALLPDCLLLRRLCLLALPPLEVSLWTVGTLALATGIPQNSQIDTFLAKYHCMAALRKGASFDRYSHILPSPRTGSLVRCLSMEVWLQWSTPA